MITVDLISLKQEACEAIGHFLAKSIFDDFSHSNNRLAIGLTCLHKGYKEIAASIFLSIIQEGPQENRDHHFAFVRSLVEMAELCSEESNFKEAKDYLASALYSFPESMDYMMSRVHLKVYLTYYSFQLGEIDTAFYQIRKICAEEEKKFQSLLLEDAQNLIGPGLCYAIHQWALFYVELKDWKKAIQKIKELYSYTNLMDEFIRARGEKYEKDGELEKAFQCYEESMQYM